MQNKYYLNLLKGTMLVPLSVALFLIFMISDGLLNKISAEAWVVPRILFSIALILIVIEIIIEILTFKVEQKSITSFTLANKNVQNLVKICSICIAYLILIHLIGFSIASLLLIFTISYLFNYTRYINTIIFTVIISFFVYGIFIYFLRLPL